MKKLVQIVLSLFCVVQFAAAAKQVPIDRQALVSRHTITTTKTNAKSPAQVGNGEFAFGVDITGLQTFMPFNTMAQWSWHSFPIPKGMKVGDFKKTPMDVHGVMKGFDLPNDEQPELSAWLARNPHRFNLGRIGLRLFKVDGTEAVAGDLTNTRQEVDLWKGIITSRFELEGVPVLVQTACDPKQDALGVLVESALIRKGQLSVFVDFPYADNREFADYVGTYEFPEKHRSIMTKQTSGSALIAREMDDARYFTSLHWNTPARLMAPTSKSSHRFLLEPTATDKLSFTCLFSQKETPVALTAKQVFTESARGWKAFWQSGAAIDLSQSKDPRWKELERRIVLSQYIMKVNEAGSLPPQESGLENNGWNGRFHFEMIWWHGVHYALWNRWPLLEKSLSVYADFLPTSQQRAAAQGYKGARWPKCTADFDREWPHITHATLIWQQPHPIFFAALDYRIHPTQKTLEKWKDIVFASADFMADFAYYEASKDRYVLGPPISIVSENTKPETTSNPTFELGYWRYGLRVAQEWRKLLSLPADKKWGEVLEKLAPLPVEDGLYVTHEGIRNMWTDFTFEHPGLTGAYGMLPGDGVDKEVFARTMDKVAATWNFDRTWGWDFPMLAMAAARCGKQEEAINYLLHPSGGFQFDEHGLATGGPFPYFPSNGALLSAVAMMAGGWDGSTGLTPGFPKDGNWTVRAENFVPLFAIDPTSREREEAGMGVERVARLFTGTYDSRQAENADAIRWVQIDLGERKKIEGIKLLPKVLPWGYVSSEGFPSRFKIEVSDDPACKDAVLYANQLEADFRDPLDEVCTFSGKVVTGRYVRLTATALRQKKLALTKLMVLSEDKDIAEGCPASDSESDNQRASILTRPARPQGEGVVTDNPGNIIAQSKWRPVSNKAQTPKSGVKLGDGLFKKTMENNISYLMTLFTFDELVRNFRVKAGKPVQPLDNRLNNMWFVDLPGQEAGSFLMGAGNTLRWMENAGLREEMNQIVDVIDACKEPDGYIMAYPKNKIFSGEYGAYTRSWVTHGLIEAGYAGNKKAFSLLRGFYDWFNTSCYLPEMLRRTGQGTQGIIPSARMYFTPVGKPKDIQVIQQYFQENYWMEQMANRDVKAIWLYPYDRPHNYLITGIEPYLDMYRATGAKKYLDASLGAWDLYHDNWEHVGGSIAICEGTDLYPPKSYYLHRSTGELCGSVFWTFLNQRFHLLYPEEEKYVAEIEQSIYNNLIANQFGNKGFRYHSNLVGHKDTQMFGLCTCCEGQGTRMTGSIPEFIYSTADDGVYVNLFASSTITFSNHARTLSLQMATQFPYDPAVQLTVSTEKPLKSSIRIRVPSWAAKKMSVRINGEVIADGNPGTYVTLDRKWNNGDVISFTLPMAFKLTKYTGEEKAYIGRFALEYGPILMAYARTNGLQDDPRLQTSAESIENNLIPVSGKPLHFTIRGVDGFEYKPYFEVENEAFSCFP